VLYNNIGGSSMSKKNSNKKNKNISNKQNNFPYSNPIAMAKDQFKKAIDEMPDDVFSYFCLSLDAFFDICDEDMIDEEWEYEDWEDNDWDGEDWEGEFWKNEISYNKDWEDLSDSIDDNMSENFSLFDDDTLPF